MTFAWIMSSVFLVSAISLVGIFTFGMRANIMDRALILLIGFAAGSMIGGAFIHLLPEALEAGAEETVFLFALAGFAVFFFMERYFHWRHCHSGACEVHAFTYLNLMGDGIHNFVDGLVIAASFVAGTKLGIVTTLAVIFHEIPQEMGDFGILVYGGFSKKKALMSNFLCALMAVIGAVAGYAISSFTAGLERFLLPFTAGGFIYIAASDLIPELHRQKDARRANAAFIAFIVGLAFMALAKYVV